MTILRKFTLDGRNMQSKDLFYQEIQRVLCPSFTKMGKNLDASVIVLRGGFGAFEHREHVELNLFYPKKAIKGLCNGFFKKVIHIFKSQSNVSFLPDLEP